MKHNKKKLCIQQFCLSALDAVYPQTYHLFPPAKDRGPARGGGPGESEGGAGLAGQGETGRLQGRLCDHRVVFVIIGSFSSDEDEGEK